MSGAKDPEEDASPSQEVEDAEEATSGSDDEAPEEEQFEASKKVRGPQPDIECVPWAVSERWGIALVLLPTEAPLLAAIDRLCPHAQSAAEKRQDEKKARQAASAQKKQQRRSRGGAAEALQGPEQPAAENEDRPGPPAEARPTVADDAEAGDTSGAEEELDLLPNEVLDAVAQTRWDCVSGQNGVQSSDGMSFPAPGILSTSATESTCTTITPCYLADSLLHHVAVAQRAEPPAGPGAQHRLPAPEGGDGAPVLCAQASQGRQGQGHRTRRRTRHGQGPGRGPVDARVRWACEGLGCGGAGGTVGRKAQPCRGLARLQPFLPPECVAHRSHGPADPFVLILPFHLPHTLAESARAFLKLRRYGPRVERSTAMLRPVRVDGV